MTDEKDKERKKEETIENDKGRRLKYFISRYKKPIAIGAAALTLFGCGIGVGYGIFGRREAKIERPPVYVKTLDEIVGELYEIEGYEALIGRNPYGNATNILKITARGSNGVYRFTVYERDPKKFSELLCYVRQAKETNNPFGILDPLVFGSGYPRDPRNIVNPRIERDELGLPVYVLEGDDLIFYQRGK